MKKIILSAALLITACINASAQFSLGIKGGVNYSTINANNLDNSSVAGYQAGVFARVGGGFYLQPEAYVSSTGGQFHSSDNSFTGNVRFTNLDIPVLVGAKFGGKNLNFRVMAGPVFTSVLNTSETLPQNFSTSFHSDFRDYKSATVDFQGGVGVDIGSVTADLRYQASVTQVNDNNSQRQNLWALSVGFKIL